MTLLADRLRAFARADQIFTDEPMTRHTTFRLGGPADVFFLPESAEQLQRALDAARARDGKLRTLFKDLTRASEFAKNKGHSMTRADLQLAIKWRKSTGAWPEDK